MKLKWRVGATMLVAAAVVAAPLPVLADTVSVTNAVVAADGSKSVSTMPGAAVSVIYALAATSTPSGDASGCDTGGGRNDVTVTVITAAGVTATPSTLVFSSCNSKSVSFTASAAGDYAITASATGGKAGSAFTTDGATFTLHVAAPNQAPTVTVSGVSQGAAYEKGSVPAARCNVTDDHDPATTFAATLSPITGSLASYGLGSQTASCSFTDSGGLTGTASATYSIVDTTAPVLSTPGDITAEATSASGATVSWTASAIDAVDPNPSITCLGAGGLGSGSTFPLGPTAVDCTATDEAGNQAHGQFTVTVQDTTKPTLSLPADITAEATGPSGAEVGYSATAADAVDGTVVPSCAPASGTTFPVATTPVNCSATDNAGNTASGGFNVTVRDTTAPNLHLPGDATLEAAGPDGSSFTYSATASDIVDGADAVSCDAASGTEFPLGTTTVSCSATDAAGNLASGSFTVTVEDTTKPALSLPSDIVAEATGPAGADIAYDVSATDLVDGNVVPDCAPANGTFAIQVTTVSCTATDRAGNTATGSFTVTVQDTLAPVFSGTPADQTVEATGPSGATATFTAPTATDLVDLGRPVTCSSATGLTSGSVFPLGATKVTCSASDTRGNTAAFDFEITVRDTTPPVLQDVPSDITAEATGPNGAAVAFTTPTATDLVDGATPVSCDAVPGDMFGLGVHTVTCSSEDAAGNVSSQSFTVTVRDTKGPDVSVPDSMTIEATGPDGAAASWSGVSATDLVDGDRPVQCDPESGSTFALGTTTVTCTAYDLSNNKGQGGFTVTVKDTTPPVLTVPGDLTREATGPNGATAEFSASATDLVDGSVAPVCTVAGQPAHSGDTFPLGDTTVSCTATDNAGNASAAKSFIVTVRDTTAPAITPPADQLVEATGPMGAAVAYTATATDLVDGTVTPSCSPASGSVFPLGATTVTCTATDAHGNSGSESFSVTVRDTTAPTLNLPGDIVVKATSAAGATVTFNATGTDVVDGTVPAVCTPQSGSVFAPGLTVVSCTATDRSGNVSNAKTFKVTVLFDWSGFFAPVDTNKVLNGMKAGSTVPLKWSVSNQTGGYLSDLSIVNMTTSGVASCDTGALVDDLSQYTTGGTQLRYDSTANQFIYNWQSPKKPGTCYTVTIGLTDGTTHSATFQLK